MKKAQLGNIALITCIMISVVYAMTNAKVELSKTTMENYQELGFLTEPYLAALSRLTYDTGTSCGETEIYELMAYAAKESGASFDLDTSKFDFCGGTINLHDVIDPYHEQFQDKFDASNYYFVLEDARGVGFFTSPKGITDKEIAGYVSVAQMPVPLPDGNVSRAVIVRSGGEAEAFSEEESS